jgi:hypothetical protein
MRTGRPKTLHLTPAEWAQKHRDQSLKYYYANKTKCRERNLKWFARQPGGHAGVVQRYRLRKLEKLAGRSKPKRCELCNKKAKRIYFDHCHKTQIFRGWLCMRCNMVLGQVDDNRHLLKKMIEYLGAADARKS